MKKATVSKPKIRGKNLRGHYVFRLYVVGDGPNSKQALLNLRRICNEHLKARFTIERIDVSRSFSAALNDNILITPSLVRAAPGPKVVILGNLNDERKVLAALGLSERVN